MGAGTQSSLRLAVPRGHTASLCLSASGAEAGITPGDWQLSGGRGGFGHVDFGPLRPCRSSGSAS